MSSAMQVDEPVMLAMPSNRAQAEGSRVERPTLSEARPELNRRVEGTAQAEPSQLASLAPPVVKWAPDYGPVKIPDFKELIAKMQAEIQRSERPQRKVFSPAELNTQNSELKTEHTNLYLALLFNPKSKIENPKLDDIDPIYSYDLNGNRTSMIDPTGITNYTYDALNRLTSVTNNKGFVTSFTYDALGRRTSMSHGNGVVTTYAYDAASQLTRLAHQLGAATINSFDYTYDRVGNRTSKTSRDGVHSYTYDTLNRLIEAINPLPTNPLEAYTYDSVGNRTNSNQNGASSFDAANRLLSNTNFTYSYDNNGNLTQKTSKVDSTFALYEYDAENKLARAVLPGGDVAIYRYDGLGRRVEKEVTQTGVTKTTKFIYDNEDILLELDGSNNITARYTHGPGIDEPLILEKGGASFFYHADGLGSVTEITDSAGVVKQRYTYSSFGKIESQLDPNLIQPYTFTAREFDPETGLYFYRARYYDSATGRFLQEDPLGFTPKDINLFLYVGNNPIRFIDPFGFRRQRSLVEEFLDIFEFTGGIGTGAKAKFNAGVFKGEVGAEAVLAVKWEGGEGKLVGQADAGITFGVPRLGEVGLKAAAEVEYGSTCEGFFSPRVLPLDVVAGFKAANVNEQLKLGGELTFPIFPPYPLSLKAGGYVNLTETLDFVRKARQALRK